MPPQGVNSSLAKQMNLQLVLQVIQGQGPVSRKGISAITGLSPAAVSGITGTLIERGLIEEVGGVTANGRVGRKAILLSINPRAGCVVGVTLALHTVSCVITDLEANILYYIESPLPFAADDGQVPRRFPAEDVIQTTIEVIERLLAAAKVDRTRLLGIGVGINGIVDVARGVSRLAPHFGWRDVAIADRLAGQFGIPVYLENDARALTIAEQWFGAGRGEDHFVTAVVGYGIGAGLVTNGRLYRGSLSGAGEFGHIVMQPGGPPCSCGRSGCLEALAGVPAILRQVREALARGEPSGLGRAFPVTIEGVAAAAGQGDPLARSVLAAAGHWLGAGLACLVNILNPRVLVITGEGVGLGPHYFESMEASLRSLVFDGLADDLRIIIEPGGHEMWARGAACVVLSALFTSPEVSAGMTAAVSTGDAEGGLGRLASGG